MREEIKSLVLEEIKKDYKLHHDYELVITKYQTLLGMSGIDVGGKDLTPRSLSEVMLMNGSASGLSDEEEFRLIDEKVNQKMEELLLRIKDNTQKIVQDEIEKAPMHSY